MKITESDNTKLLDYKGYIDMIAHEHAEQFAQSMLKDDKQRKARESLQGMKMKE